MEIKASAKYLRVNPRKLRLLSAGLVGFPAQRAIEKLEFYPQRGQEFLVKLIKQAVANAKNNLKLRENGLIIKSLEVGEGPSSKRIDKSHGARFDRGTIKKKTAHLFITLSSKEETETKSKPRAVRGKGEITESPSGVINKAVKKLVKDAKDRKVAKTKEDENGTED